MTFKLFGTSGCYQGKGREIYAYLYHKRTEYVSMITLQSVWLMLLITENEAKEISRVRDGRVIGMKQESFWRRDGLESRLASMQQQ